MKAIVFRPARDDDVRTFAAWRYEPPYDAYDIAEEIDSLITYFQGPEIECYVLFEKGDLIGFCTFGQDAQVPGGDYSQPALDIGLGIKPALTGLGRGDEFVGAVLDHAEAIKPRGPRRVTIATWNERAQRAWRGAGFEVADRFTTDAPVMGTREFLILVAE